MRLLTVISGIIFVLAGAFCAVNPGETFLSLAFIIGAVMLISSVIQAIAYLQGRGGNRKDNNGWILAEAMLTFLLGGLVLANQITADVAVPMVFGMWSMCSGILRIVSASQINREYKRSNFIWTLMIGILCILGGLYAFVNLNTVVLPIAILLGFLLILQGISILELGIHMPHQKSRKRKQEAKQQEELLSMQTIEAQVPERAADTAILQESSADRWKQKLQRTKSEKQRQTEEEQWEQEREALVRKIFPD